MSQVRIKKKFKWRTVRFGNKLTEYWLICDFKIGNEEEEILLTCVTPGDYNGWYITHLFGMDHRLSNYDGVGYYGRFGKLRDAKKKAEDIVRNICKGFLMGKQLWKK